METFNVNKSHKANILLSDDIAAYFGVKVALYFAWLGHYTCALGVPAVFGTILYCILWGKGQTAQDMGHVLFSLFNVAWASLYLEAWKRYSVELAFRWGTLSTPPELLEPPRPLYKVSVTEVIDNLFDLSYIADHCSRVHWRRTM